MIYQEFLPSQALADLIKCYWVLEDDEIPQTPIRDRILPDGCAEIIFHYGDHFIQYNGEQAIVQPRSFVFGQLTQFIEIGPSGRTGIIAARFYPHGAGILLGLPMNELTGQAIEIESVFGQHGKQLEEQIMEAATMHNRIGLLDTFFLRRLNSLRNQDAIIADCVKLIGQSRGLVSVEALSDDLNLSVRQLQRKFTSLVGMNPKRLARIARFQHLFGLLKKDEIGSLTALALEAGYFDQAHFIRDFKQFSGVNPSTYFKESGELSAFFTAQS